MTANRLESQTLSGALPQIFPDCLTFNQQYLWSKFIYQIRHSPIQAIVLSHRIEPSVQLGTYLRWKEKIDPNNPSHLRTLNELLRTHTSFGQEIRSITGTKLWHFYPPFQNTTSGIRRILAKSHPEEKIVLSGQIFFKLRGKLITTQVRHDKV